MGMSGGGDFENFRTEIFGFAILSILSLFWRCEHKMWFIKPSVPSQIILQSGHLCIFGASTNFGLSKPLWCRVNFGGWIASLRNEFIWKLFCRRCVIKCFFNVDISRKGRLHSIHVNGFSPVCIITWRFKFELLPNTLSQNLQTNDFPFFASDRCSIASISMRWSFFIASRCPQSMHFIVFRFDTGFRWQTEHFSINSDSWIFLCFLRSLCSRKRRLQTGHSNGFSPKKSEKRKMKKKRKLKFQSK